MFLLCDPAGDNYSKTCVSELKIFSAEQNILQTVYIQINGVTEHRTHLFSHYNPVVTFAVGSHPVFKISNVGGRLYCSQNQTFSSMNVIISLSDGKPLSVFFICYSGNVRQSRRSTSSSDNKMSSNGCSLFNAFIAFTLLQNVFTNLLVCPHVLFTD